VRAVARLGSATGPVPATAGTCLSVISGRYPSSRRGRRPAPESYGPGSQPPASVERNDLRGTCQQYQPNQLCDP
jgi:hypothetical protein